MASTLGNTLEFFRDFGIFDVVLPFLLVFTVVFAVLQKTHILGKDQNNLDAMVAFVIGLLFVAATKAVSIVSDALPQIMVLVIVGMSFLLMVGIFAQPDGSFLEKLPKPVKYISMVVMSIAVVLIFLGNITNERGQSWLSYGWNYLFNFWDSAVIGSIILLVIVVGAIFFVVGGKKDEKKETSNR